MKKRKLTQERLKEILDYNPKTGKFRWRPRAQCLRAGQVAGCRVRSVYLVIHIGGRSYRAHQLAWLYMKGEWGLPLIDHRDGNPLNNRFNNLRLSNFTNSNANRRRPQNNTSGFKGVTRDRQRDKWKAIITKNGCVRCLGRFATAREAHAAYVAAARVLFGKFARGK